MKSGRYKSFAKVVSDKKRFRIERQEDDGSRIRFECSFRQMWKEICMTSCVIKHPTLSVTAYHSWSCTHVINP